MLKNYDTLWSRFSNCLVPTFLPNSFIFLSPFILPLTKKYSKGTIHFKRVRTQLRWKAVMILRCALAAISCTVMIMLMFHDDTCCFCDGCDSVFCFDTLEKHPRNVTFLGHNIWLPILQATLGSNQNEKQWPFSWGKREY